MPRTAFARWWCAKQSEISSQLAHDQSLFDLDAKYADVVSSQKTAASFQRGCDIFVHR